MTNTNVTIRPAVPTDLDTLIDLNEVVQSLHARLEPAHFKENVDADEVKAFFTDLLDRTDNGILIAEMRSNPVGYIWFEFQSRDATPFSPPRRRVYIHHVSVNESARRMGIASALMQAVESEAQSKDMKRIILDTWCLNTGAQEFFRARGFLSFNIVLGKNLTHALKTGNLD